MGEQVEPRERILAAAARLFATKGFDATGVRELATEAGVNLAMVNYYFGSKEGVVSAVISRFSNAYLTAMREELFGEGVAEDRLRRGVRAAIQAIRADIHGARTMFCYGFFRAEEVAEHNGERLRELIEPIYKLVAPLMAERAGRETDPMVFGPALGGILAFHFMMKPLIECVFATEISDEFYETFPDKVADILLYGLMGLRPENSGPREG